MREEEVSVNGDILVTWLSYCRSQLHKYQLVFFSILVAGVRVVQHPLQT